MKKMERTKKMLDFFAEMGRRGLSDSKMMRKSRLLMEEYRVLYEQAQALRNADFERAAALALRSPEVFECRKQISQMIGVFLGLFLIPVLLMLWGIDVFDSQWLIGCYVLLGIGVFVETLRKVFYSKELELDVAYSRLYELELGAVYFYQDSELFCFLHEKILNYLAKIEGLKSDFYLFLEKENLPEKQPRHLSHSAYQRRLKSIQKQIKLSLSSSELRKRSPRALRQEAKMQYKQERDQQQRYIRYWNDRVNQKIQSLSEEYDVPVAVIYSFLDLGNL